MLSHRNFFPEKFLGFHITGCFAYCFLVLLLHSFLQGIREKEIEPAHFARHYAITPIFSSDFARCCSSSQPTLPLSYVNRRRLSATRALSRHCFLLGVAPSSPILPEPSLSPAPSCLILLGNRASIARFWCSSWRSIFVARWC